MQEIIKQDLTSFFIFFCVVLLLSQKGILYSIFPRSCLNEFNRRRVLLTNRQYLIFIPPCVCVFFLVFSQIKLHIVHIFNIIMGMSWEMKYDEQVNKKK